MYPDIENANDTWPIFAKVDGRIIPWLDMKGLLILGAALLLAFGLNHVLSGWTHEVEVAKTQDEIELEYTELARARTAASLDSVTEELASLSLATGEPRQDLAEDELERYYELLATSSLLKKETAAMLSSELIAARSLAQEQNITQTTSDEELLAMIELTRTDTLRVVPATVSLFVCALIVLAAAAFVLEPEEGRTLAGYLTESRKFNKKQHEYLYSRLTGSYTDESKGE